MEIDMHEVTSVKVTKKNLGGLKVMTIAIESREGREPYDPPGERLSVVLFLDSEVKTRVGMLVKKIPDQRPAEDFEAPELLEATS